VISSVVVASKCYMLWSLEEEVKKQHPALLILSDNNLANLL